MSVTCAKPRLALALWCLVVGSLLVPAAVHGQTQTQKDRSDVLLQGFHWESYSYWEGGRANGWYRILDSAVDQIAEAGFTVVWLPPPSYGFAGDGTYPHSRGFLPIEYYNLETSYGSSGDLKNLVHDLHGRNVRVIADLVINHRTEPDSNHKCWFSNPDWGPWAVVRNDASGCGQGNWDSGQEIPPFADIDHSNQRVREDIRDWMRWLRSEVGFDGWRFDLVRGYAGSYVEYYNREGGSDFSVGEYWPDHNGGCQEGFCYNQDRPRQEILDWIDSTWKNTPSAVEKASRAFDFPTKAILQEAVRNNQYWRLRDGAGKAPGIIGLWPAKAVTFIENHDTGSTQKLWPFSDKPEDVLMGYAYILTHPGVPCVFYDHFFYWKDSAGTPLSQQIKTLMALRTRQNIHADSRLEILRAEQGLYAAQIDDRVAIKLGPNSWSPSGDGWHLSTYGMNFAVWER